MPDTRYRPFPTTLSDPESSALEPPLPARRPGSGAPWSGRAASWRRRSSTSSGLLPALVDGVLGVRAPAPRRRAALHARPLAEADGRDAEPSAAIVDSQTARGTGVGGPARGWDGAKRTTGRERHILVDATGLVLLARVDAADLHGRSGAQARAARAAPGEPPRLELVRGGGAYAGIFARWLQAERGWRVGVPRHRRHQAWRYGLEERPKRFHVIPRRWVVERTFAWLSRSRRLARDCECLPETG